MTNQLGYLDIAAHWLNKKNEELCGDRVIFHREDDRVIIVHADGLGSGVKANILATLTVTIAMTMIKQGESIQETINTIIKTLPICKVRNIAYATFCIIEVYNDGHCTVVEYDNPPVFLVRNGMLIRLQGDAHIISDKKVTISKFKMQEGDFLTIISDGAVYAGLGEVFNHGWEWKHIAEFLTKQSPISAEYITQKLIRNCHDLYGGKPGDDTSVATIMYRSRQELRIFTGPPECKEKDAIIVKDLMSKNSESLGDNTTIHRVVCGGTAGNITARILNRELITNFDYICTDIPPTGKIKGIDLVTEGVFTLSALSNILDDYFEHKLIDFNQMDASTALLNLIVHHTTDIKILMGKAINPAHQQPDFPIELSLKSHVIEKLIKKFKIMGKNVTVKYY